MKMAKEHLRTTSGILQDRLYGKYERAHQKAFASSILLQGRSTNYITEIWENWERTTKFLLRDILCNAYLPQLDLKGLSEFALAASLMQKNFSRLHKFLTNCRRFAGRQKRFQLSAFMITMLSHKAYQHLEKAFCPYCHRSTENKLWFVESFAVLLKSKHPVNSIDEELSYVRLRWEPTLGEAGLLSEARNMESFRRTGST